MNLYSNIVKHNNKILTHIAYLGNQKWNIKEIQENIRKTKSYIQFVTNQERNETTLLWLQSNVRGKGYARFLFEYMINYSKENGIKKILLDDCSENFRKEHNIYVNFGVKYIDDYGPEMEGNVDEIFDLVKYNR